MESNGKFTLIVFNTCTQEYEEVIVTEEVYRTYCRTRWNIKDNDQSFFDHEIQTSGMIGSQDGAYENFREFIDAINTPEHIILEQIKKEALYQAISALPAADQALVQGLFFKGQSELDYKVSTDDLVKLKRIRKAAEQGEFDILLVFMYDRLGRNLNETPFIAEWFTKKGIHVWSVYEGEIIDGVDAERMLDYIRFWQTDEAQKL